MRKVKDYIQLARPKHWIKNILIFVPCLFGGEIFQANKLTALFIGFISFSLVASRIYYINDIKDVDKDRHHEIKKNRPIASGRVSVRSAWTIAMILAILSYIIVFLFFKGKVCIKAAAVLAIYFLVNLLYSSGLKNRPILDVMILASGFVLRVIYGSAIGNVEISQWLLLTILMFSLYMGLGKRRNELRKAADASTRNVLTYYTVEYLSRIMLLTMTLGLVFYSLWAAVVVAQGDILVWTVPLVIAILMKYELDVDKYNFGDPVEILTNDSTIVIMLTVYAMIVIFVLYILR